VHKIRSLPGRAALEAVIGIVAALSFTLEQYDDFMLRRQQKRTPHPDLGRAMAAHPSRPPVGAKPVDGEPLTGAERQLLQLARESYERRATVPDRTFGRSQKRDA
jgi:hypothetical protein